MAAIEPGGADPPRRQEVVDARSSGPTDRVVQLRFAYCDPPYPGGAHLYKDHPDYAGEVDHRALIERLVAEYPDGWALSTNSTTLQFVLGLCPPDVRILAWVKPWYPFRASVRLAYCWEPVLLRGGRRRGREFDTVRDWHAASYENGVTFYGQKPETFCFWLFNALGALPGDTLDDLFPGSGAVGRAWDKYQRQVALPLGGEREKQVRMAM